MYSLVAIPYWLFPIGYTAARASRAHKCHGPRTGHAMDPGPWQWQDQSHEPDPLGKMKQVGQVAWQLLPRTGVSVAPSPQ